MTHRKENVNLRTREKGFDLENFIPLVNGRLNLLNKGSVSVAGTEADREMAWERSSRDSSAIIKTGDFISNTRGDAT